ncbi:hypothetical protein A0J61_07545, partial [Choanephora cucurbitarum]
MVETKYKRCKIFDDRYKKIKILGKGNFGEVFLAEDFVTRKRDTVLDIDDPQKVAIKVVDTKKFRNEDQKRHAENEKEICRLFSKREFRHPHI